MNNYKQIRRIRVVLLFFMIALAVSGITAVPIHAELSFLLRMVPEGSGLEHWLAKVLAAYDETATHYPFLLYGYDWLAFAHVVLAIAFIGPYRDPVRNTWVIEFGIIACVLILPLALFGAGFRGIPFGWRLIDCSFGIFGAIPLIYCRYTVLQLTKLFKQSSYGTNR